MTLKQYVIANVKADDYYAKRFPSWNPRVRGNVKCPFHDDGKPSLAIALQNGGAKCHGGSCAKSIGNIVHFESTLRGVGEKLAAKQIYREFIRPLVSKKQIQEYRDHLAENTHYLVRIKKEMGLTPAFVRRFNLGLDPETRRITIPVYDQFGQCVNIRFYRLPSERTTHDAAKIYNLKGYGRLDLFPFSQLDNLQAREAIFFMAGEKDCLLGIQNGLRCITSTAGEGSWDSNWNEYFARRTVYLVFDRDKGGEKGTQRILEFLKGCGARLVPISLPFKSARADRKDFADWVLKEGGSADKLRQHISKSVGAPQRADDSDSDTETSISPSVRELWNLTRKGEQVELPLGEDAHERQYPKCPEFFADHLFNLADISSRAELLNYRIKTQGIVAAKSPHTYSIPWKFNVQIRNRPVFSYELPAGRELLRFVQASDGQILQSLQRLVNAANATIVPTDYVTVTEVELIPIAAVDKDVPYVVQNGYYFGEEIKSNVPYYLEVIPTSEIRTQKTVGIITHYEPVSKSIDKFEMTPAVEADLSVFQPEGEKIWSKLKSIANEISHHYTRVYNRLDWHLVALLTWCSPIQFRFPNEPELQRGWLNSLALGDTETGKSKVAKALQQAFGTGVFVNSENCTYVGLIGGAIKMGSGQLMLRWGRIPLSDKQLVVLEELSGLSVDEIANMSEVRSSGKARLDKGGINQETSARTRLLCLSNVRSERKGLSNYLYGVRAIQELIGHGEDIARFDFITTLVDKEVSIDLINARDFATVTKTIHQDQLQKLCHFIWSLTPEQIHFTEDAYEACLEYTKELSADYHPSIPIFKGGSGRYKLGRIAAAIACLLFAYDTKQKKVIVSRAHVAASVKLLRLIYDKASFGYSEYSSQMYDRENVKNPKLLTQAFQEKIPDNRLAAVLETLIHSTRFSRDELCAIAGINILHADQLIGTMVRERALRKGDANLWEIEPSGKQFMENLMNKYGPSHSRSSKVSSNNKRPTTREPVRTGSQPKRVSRR